MPGRETRGGAQLDKILRIPRSDGNVRSSQNLGLRRGTPGGARAGRADEGGGGPRVMAWPAVISGLFKPAAPPPFSQARPRAPRLPCNCSTQLPRIIVDMEGRGQRHGLLRPDFPGCDRLFSPEETGLCKATRRRRAVTWAAGSARGPIAVSPFRTAAVGKGGVRWDGVW